MPEVNKYPDTAMIQSDHFNYVGLCNRDVFHMTSDTRLSRFSVCIIEKLGVAHKAIV